MHINTTLISAAFVAVCIALTGAGPVGAMTLITDAEAKLPPAPQVTMRGVVRGPTVAIVQPASPERALKAPFDIKVKFEAHGGTRIDPASVHVVYLRTPLVDLTDRVRPFVTVDGIDLSRVEVPPGTHAIQIEVKDSDGRVGRTSLRLSVNP